MKRELTPIQREFQRRFATAIPPPGAETATCACGCIYEDWDGGRMAHDVVFGHPPIKPATDEEGTS